MIKSMPVCKNGLYNVSDIVYWGWVLVGLERIKNIHV